MILYPAIDLKDSACVRLLRGDMEQATIYGTDPGAQARAFEAAGANWLHVVDLNGAISGQMENDTAVAAILEAVTIPVQLGGGIRDLDAVEHWISAGVMRVVLGTAAVKAPELVHEACQHFAGRIAVGIDARNGIAAVEGWTESAGVPVRELAQSFTDAAAIIYTDIERDGALTGINVEATAALARAIPTPVIASGGVSSAKDLVRLKAYREEGISGVICGRALYDGRLDVAAALSALED